MTGAEPADVVVRRAERPDLPTLAEVHLAAREAADMPPGGEADRVREWVAGWDLGDHEVWVADSQEGPVGYARLHGAWLDDLYVAPAYQGRGVGSLLLDVVCSVRPSGFGLWVFTGNARARAFYAARGLVELEHTDGSGNQERAPDVHLLWPGERPLQHLREAIDTVDDDLALLLARRFALAGAVQDHKAATLGNAGHDARDPRREADIVERMARLVPSLPPERLRRVVGVVLEEGLSAWHDRVRPAPARGTVGE